MNGVGTNYLNDAIERLQRSEKNGSQWETSVDLALSIGASAVNIGWFTSSAFLPTWARISMATDLVEEFTAREFQYSDPIMKLRASGQLAAHSTLSLPDYLRQKDLTAAETACYRFLIDAKYSNYRVVRGEDTRGEYVIAFAGEADNIKEVSGLGTAQIGALSSLIARFTMPPTPEDAAGHVRLLYTFLAPRERDVLSYMAKGMSNDQIAEKLGLAEVTVRLHMRRARIKMGAATREQALALALLRGLIVL